MKRFVKYSYILIIGIVIGTVLSNLLSKDKELKNDVEKISNTNNTEEVELGDTATYFDSINVHYDNTSSGLTNDTVKEAIDELYDIALQKECAKGFAKSGTTTFTYTCAKKCISAKAGTLHTETCGYTSGSSYCYADGYSDSGSKGTTTITYGSVWDGVSALKAGDAFDCDVNGNGIIDTDANGKSTERFYYVSPYYNTNTKKYDGTTGYATLIYYSNTYNGVASTSGAAYATQADIQAAGYTCSNWDGCNWYGPISGVNHLPTTTQWSNIELKTDSRTIYACPGGHCYYGEYLTTEQNNNQIQNPYSYSGRAARLLTAEEVAKGCHQKNNVLSAPGDLSQCNFFFEGTRYANSNIGTYAVWLETADSITYYAAGGIYVSDRDLKRQSISGTSNTGIRPAIDVKYSDLSY